MPRKIIFHVVCFSILLVASAFASGVVVPVGNLTISEMGSGLVFPDGTFQTSAKFSNYSISSNSSSNAFTVNNAGSGNAISGTTTGTGNAAIFTTNNPSNPNNTLYAISNGEAATGYFANTGNGTAGYFFNTSANPAGYFNNTGTGAAGYFANTGNGAAGYFFNAGTYPTGYFTNTGTGAAGYFASTGVAPALYAAVDYGFGYAAVFVGDVSITGKLTKGGGSFKIDHPIDPRNKYLYHSFVESPDMMNIYNGTAVTDTLGYATITLPVWFEALNREFRYQLTILDEGDSTDFVQAKVVRKIAGNTFIIRTSNPRTEVSWQVTGIRRDPYAEKNRIQVEVEKPLSEKGTCLYPEACVK